MGNYLATKFKLEHNIFPLLLKKITVSVLCIFSILSLLLHHLCLEQELEAQL